MKYDFDCVIIGAGIAGMTAAIYLKRFNCNILLLDSNAPGGLLNKINKIENYPGFKSITGPDLAYNIFEQVTNLGIEFRYGNVLEIEDHVVKTDIEQITTKKIIIAIGRTVKKLDTNAKNVSYCTICDGNLYKNKVVGFIGNNKSFEDLKYLNTLAQKIYCISKEELSEEIKTLENIEIIKGTLKSLNIEENILNTIEIGNQKLKVDGLFVSLGYEPHSENFSKIIKEKGYIVVNEKMQTNIPYIYACGDIIKKEVYQLTTAVSEATIAAINIKKSL